VGHHAAGNALLGTALMFPFAEMIQIEKLNPELQTSSQATLSAAADGE